MPRPRLHFSVAFACALALASLPRFALPTAGAQDEGADALIEQGVRLRAQGRDRRALRLFEQAHRAAPSAEALAQIALAEQAIGHWRQAEEHLTEAIRARRDPWIAPRISVLRTALNEIREHLRFGGVELSGGDEGALVTVDEEPGGALPLEGPLRLREGEHQLTVRAADGRTFARSIEVRRGDVQRIEVALVEGADALIEAGLALRQEGRDEDALALFEQALAASPSGQALAQIALAEQALSRWREAEAHLAEALRGYPEEDWIGSRAAVLEGALSGMREHNGVAAIDATGPEGAELLLDGEPRGTLPLDAALRVEPGAHRIEILFEGATLAERELDLEAGESHIERVRRSGGGGGGSDLYLALGGVTAGLTAASLAAGLALTFYLGELRGGLLECAVGDTCATLLTAEEERQILSDTDVGAGMEIGMIASFAAAGAFAIVTAALFAVGAVSSGGGSRSDSASAALSCAPLLAGGAVGAAGGSATTWGWSCHGRL